MPKGLKVLLIGLLILIFLAALVFVGWRFVLFPAVVEEQVTSPDPLAEMEAFAEEAENVDLDDETGMLYVNNEVIVFFAASASQKEIQDLLSDQDADVDEAMADLGIYRLIYPDAMPYEDLEHLVRKLKRQPIVEDAYINLVSEVTGSAEADFEEADPVYPDDPWNEDTWDLDAPSGENWGMEAVRAPAAWGYLDQMQPINVGLIDNMPDVSHEDLTFSDHTCYFVNDETGQSSPNRYALTAQDHGSHVAGIMAADWDNETGCSGVMGGMGRLHYSAVYYETSSGITSRYNTAFSYLLALRRLIEQDVQVINVSQNTNRLIGFAASRGNQSAINYLTAQADLTEAGLLRIIEQRQAENKPDFVICVSSGNSNNTYYYPDENLTYGYRTYMTEEEKLQYPTGWRGEIGDSLACYNNFLSLMNDEAVQSRVIVVGSAGIDHPAVISDTAQYVYSPYACVGERVDITAPGDNVYSCLAGGYGALSGTSMAAPHVSGVAGLVFACNPDLTGPQVKAIVTASTTGRFYYTGGYSGMVNAELAVINALKTRSSTVEQVLQQQVDNGLDLCFVIDTTSSMEDDIDNAKANMAEILSHLGEKTENYRVALVDYRDFPDRTEDSDDYACRVHLPFSSDTSLITNAIYGLDLGFGGDTEETVYSALMTAVSLDWREDAKKVIIILGDAAPLDPEPYTDYTYHDVLQALIHADIQVDLEDSDDRVVGDLDLSQISVYTIDSGSDLAAADFFSAIAVDTGGSYAAVENADEVSTAIMDSIDQIEVAQLQTATVAFGPELADSTITLYNDDGFFTTLTADAQGKFTIQDMPPDTYQWRSDTLTGGGTLRIRMGERHATVKTTSDHRFAPLLRLWQQHKLPVCAAAIAFLLLCALAPLLVRGICTAVSRPKKPRKQKASARKLSCPACGIANAPGAQFCRSCGASMTAPAEEPSGEESQTEETQADSPAEPVCPGCGRVCVPGERFCRICGTSLSTDEMPSAP